MKNHDTLKVCMQKSRGKTISKIMNELKKFYEAAKLRAKDHMKKGQINLYLKWQIY